MGMKGKPMENKYEIRSIDQLEYINWNSKTKNTNTLVDSNTYMYYPYLQKYGYTYYTINTQIILIK